MSLLRATHLAKSYRKRQVISDLSIEVESGQIVGLLGPNVAGKTTAFYMIVGLVPPDAGTVTIDDRDITHLAMHQRAHGCHDIGAAAIVDGEVDNETTVCGRCVHGGFQLATDLRWEGIQPADRLKTDIVLLQIGQFLAEVIAEEAPKGFDFMARALPVLHGEGVQREHFDAEPGAGFD